MGYCRYSKKIDISKIILFIFNKKISPRHFCHWVAYCAHSTKKACGYQCHKLPFHPPLQIYSTSSWIHIWNPVGFRRWNFFAETANAGYFSRGAPSLMFDGILNAMRVFGGFYHHGYTKEILNSVVS